VIATRQAAVRALPQAQLDLIALWTSLADNGPKQADGFLDRIAQKLGLLAMLPVLGCERPDLDACLHSYAVGDFQIYFRIADAGIEIVRVLHRACDPASCSRVETP
jgi:plasmid stabilization system protein ParE